MVQIDPTLVGGPMDSLLTLLGIVAAWYILNRWILPKLGVST